MKHYKLRKLQTHRHFTRGRFLVGIDPDGLPIGATFSFKHSFTGFHHHLWKRLAARLPNQRRKTPARVGSNAKTASSRWADYSIGQGTFLCP